LQTTENYNYTEYYVDNISRRAPRKLFPAIHNPNPVESHHRSVNGLIRLYCHKNRHQWSSKVSEVQYDKVMWAQLPTCLYFQSILALTWPNETVLLFRLT